MCVWKESVSKVVNKKCEIDKVYGNVKKSVFDCKSVRKVVNKCEIDKVNFNY